MKRKHRIIIGIIVAILALGTIITIIFPQALITPVAAPTEVPRNDSVDANLATSTNPNDKSDLIVVNSPSKGATVSSPFVITGKARGQWYFEASFPIELVDTNTGLDIASGHAEAQGDWMTDAFVPFTATLTFTKQPSPTGARLILRKDNPSGLAENEDSIEIPLIVK